MAVSGMTEKKNGFPLGYLRVYRHSVARPVAPVPLRGRVTHKFIAIALLLLLLLQLAGYFLIFTVQRFEIHHVIKQQLKAGIPEGELVLLKIPKNLEEKTNSLFQRIHEREFRYDGSMYDVVRQETHGDTTWYYCLSDEKETQLFANLDEFVKREVKQQTKRKALLAKLLNFFGGGFFYVENKFSPAGAAAEIITWDYLFKLKTWISPPLTPPPEA